MILCGTWFSVENKKKNEKQKNIPECIFKWSEQKY